MPDATQDWSGFNAVAHEDGESHLEQINCEPLRVLAHRELTRREHTSA